MGRNETPSWLDQPSEPENNDQQANLPPWLREENAEAETPAAEEPALPPWLRQPDEEREMLRGEQLSEEWLSNADSLIHSVDTELTYDEWLAMQQERARPKSIEEEVPDLLSDLPSNEAPEASQLQNTGELPDWFLGLEELDTSDAPDWFVGGASEEPPPTPPPAASDAPPSWINDLQQAQAEEPEPEEDAVDDFFSTLGRSSTLPSGASMDDLFGEFAMPSADEDSADDVPPLDWVTGQPQSASQETYGTPEMDDFFRTLAQPTKEPRRTPPPEPENELPDSGTLLSRLPKEEDEFPALNNLGTRRLNQQPTDFSQFIEDGIPEPDPEAFIADDDDGEIEEPDLEWFTRQPSPASTPLLPDIDIDPEPDIPEPEDAELYSEDTVNWLSELENIVSSVTRPEEEVRVSPEDFYPVEEPEEAAPVEAPEDEPVAGRGDEFDWSQLEPYQETEDGEQPRNWFDQFSAASAETEGESDKPAAPPPTARLTGILNRIRETQEASVQDITPEEPTPEEHLESLLMTEDLLSEAENTPFSSSDADDLFASPPEMPQAEPSEDSSVWGSLNLDALIREASAAAPAPQEEESGGFGQLDDYNFADLLQSAEAKPKTSDEEIPGFDAEDEQPGVPPTPSLTGLLSRISADALNLTDSEQEDEPEAYVSIEDVPDFTSVESETSEEVYQPQWGAEDEQAVVSPAEDTLAQGEITSETPEELYQPQWGAPEDNVTLDEEQAVSQSAADTAEDDLMEDAEDLGDMSWLTDEIFVETGEIAPAEDEQPAEMEADAVEPVAQAEFEAEAEPADDDFLAELAALHSEFATDETEEKQTDDDFLTELQGEESAAAEESVFDSEYSVSWETDEEEAGAAVPAEDDFLAELQSELAANDDTVQSDDDDDAGDYAILWEAEDEQPDSLDDEALQPADENFLKFLEPETSAETPPDAGFDDSFLASLDTLDQMQASGQSRVGDDLFSTLFDEQAEAAADDAENEDEQPQEEETPDWLVGEAVDEATLEQELFGTLDLDEQPNPFEQPEFDEDFFASLETEAEAPTVEQKTYDEDLFAAFPTDERGVEGEESSGQPEFKADFLTTTDEDEAQPADVIPDLFGSLGMEEAATDDDDFFREMGLVDAASEEESAVDWLSELGAEEADQEDESFPPAASTPAQASDDEEPAWLRALSSDQPEASEAPDWMQELTDEKPQVEAAAADEWDNWLSDYNPSAEAEADAELDEAPEVGPIEDLDSYLASLTGQEAALSPGTKELLAQEDFDIDALLEAPLIDEDRQPPSQTQPFVSPTEPTITPDWLTDVHATVGEVSAGAMVRQRKDRPEGELDSRLKKLRQRGDKVPAASTAASDDSLSDVLPDVEDTLAPAPMRTGTPSLVGAITLSSDQRERVALLKTLVMTEDEPAPKRLSAIELTYDNALYQLDLEEEGDTVVQPKKPAHAPRRAKPARRRRLLPRIRLDRLLITLLLAGGVIGPFLLPQLRVGNLPSAAFVAGSAQEEAHTRLDRLTPGALVLFAVEYSPAAAAELDPMTDALLRHVLMQNAYPVVISGNPLALLRVGNLLDAINADEAFLERIGADAALQPNLDYYVVRYLPGSTIGLRAFSADTARLLLTDIRGQATGLNVLSLRDFPVIVVVADRAEDVRSYAEQVAPLADAAVIAAVSYSAAPLVEPYVNADILSGPPALSGLLVGYGDAYTYNTLIGNTLPVERGESRAVPIIRTTPQATATPTFTVTPRFTPTPSMTPTPAPIGRAVVTATQTVNLRPEPNTNNTPIGQLPPGTLAEIIGFNDDRSWVNIRMADGQEGWISAQLVQIEEGQSALPKQENVAKQPAAPDVVYRVGGLREAPRHPQKFRKSNPLVSPILQDEDATAEPTAEATEEPTSTRRPTRTPRPTATPRPDDEATAEATLEPGAEFTPEATAEAGEIALPPHSPDYRDERWYAMTLGIIISATVISFGAIVNIVRSILRRRR